MSLNLSQLTEHLGNADRLYLLSRPEMLEFAAASQPANPSLLCSALNRPVYDYLCDLFFLESNVSGTLERPSSSVYSRKLDQFRTTVMDRLRLTQQYICNQYLVQNPIRTRDYTYSFISTDFH